MIQQTKVDSTEIRVSYEVRALAEIARLGQDIDSIIARANVLATLALADETRKQTQAILAQTAMLQNRGQITR